MPNDLAKLQRNPREVARWQEAQQLVLGDRHASAQSRYRELVKRFPGVAQLWFELGIAAAGQLDFAAAETAFAQAQSLAPRDVSLLVLLGQQYHRLRRLDKARSCFQAAVAADPASIHAQLSLAAWFERERRLAEASQCVDACLSRHPDHPQVRCVQALLLQRQGRLAEAERLLRDLVGAKTADANVRFSSRHLLGVVLDEMGQYAEAFHWLTEAKGLARQLNNTARMEQDYDRAAKRRRALLSSLTPEITARWRAEAPATHWGHGLALLGGHPRSGTTLLEQILGAHPDILAVDESEAFAHEIWHELAPMNAAQGLTLPDLDGLAVNRRADLRKRYLKSLLREVPGEPAARVLLDKNPSPTAALHIWLRVFPDLKVIIALRDPRDVVLSCFFQNLMLTPANANFLTLERTARHYADMMDVWLRMRELGGLDWCETRYEDVVGNVDHEARRVTEFLGLSWHPNQASHYETAHSKFVFSPTYTGATQPVHRRAVGRWHCYAEMLAPVEPLLAPYCKAFGYDS